MSVRTRMGLTHESEQVISRNQNRAQRVLDFLDDAVKRVLIEVENHLIMNKLRGGSVHEKRDGKTPLASRSGTLMQAATHVKDEKLSGYVGFLKHVQDYAKVLLGPDIYTIKPKTAKNLWIPIGDNLTGKGVMRMSPSELFDQKGPRGGKLLSLFTSNAGNLIASLRRPAHVPGVRHKRDRLMFVLKKSVTVKGTDGLAEAARDKIEFAREQFHKALMEGLA